MFLGMCLAGEVAAILYYLIRIVVEHGCLSGLEAAVFAMGTATIAVLIYGIFLLAGIVGREVSGRMIDRHR